MADWLGVDMKNDTPCSQCEEPALARGLCASHYGKARRAGELPARQKKISNVDLESKTCDCPTHGVAVRLRIRLRSDGYARYSCRKCDRAAPPTGAPRVRVSKREAHLRRTYGISLAEYQLRIEGQQGCCPICTSKLERPVVDHDHEKGHVRGILCNPCNLGLGFFRDNPVALSRAATYLKRNADPR